MGSNQEEIEDKDSGEGTDLFDPELIVPFNRGLILNSISSRDSLEKAKTLFREFWHMPFIPPLTDLSSIESYVDEISVFKWNPNFFWSISWNPDHISALAEFGFLPMAHSEPDGTCVLLPKLHSFRCVLNFSKDNLLIGKSKKIRKQSRQYLFSVDKDIDGVFDGIQAQHSNNWMCFPLRQALKSFFNKDNSKFRVHSIEVWRRSEDSDCLKLVAGEIGYAFGGNYTSMTGFRAESGSGTLQLALLGNFLKSRGFLLWDLGMTMAYKLELGAREVCRAEFLDLFRRAKSVSTNLECADAIPACDILGS